MRERRHLGLAVKTRPAPTHTVVLVGNPNVGKSTLFNNVTGAQQAVVNAPGTTVDVMTGTWRTLNVRLLDLPGTYSLIPNSPDEKVVADVLNGEITPAGRGIDLVLAVVDGSSLTRSLYLIAQLAQTGHPIAVVITMADVASAENRALDPSVLTRELGVPVMLLDPRRNDHDTLDAFVRDALKARPRVRGLDPDPSAPGFGGVVVDAGRCGCGSACGCDGANQTHDAHQTHDAGCACSDTNAQPGNSAVCGCGHTRVTTLGIPKIGQMPPATGSPGDTGATGVETYSEREMQRAATLFSWVERVESAVSDADRNEAPGLSRSDKIDRILLHPVLGLLVFFSLMWLLFKLAGEWVGPVQDFFDGLFTATDPGAFSLANGFIWILAKVGLGGSWVESALVGGVATGLGVVASFVPLMFAIFAAITILEDSGYMARAAFLGDRLMRTIGLDGRVILPLIMGFGCNLPSLAAAKTLPSARQRLVTVLITPYTSCAARLTIYLMMARIFFPDNAGTVVFAMYVASLVMVVLGAWVLKFFITKDEAQAPLMLILPAYQVPRLGIFLTRALRNSWMFIKGAGKIIVTMTLIVWLLGAIPVSTNDDGGFASPELAMEDSAYGATAKILEPIFTPAGFGDWHMSGALMTGFVAKETVVSSIVAAYNMDESAAGDAEENGSNLGALPGLLTDTFTKTAGEGLQGLAAIAFLVFVLTYTPCLATVAEQARLIGGKRTALAVLVQLVSAWVLAVAVFQIGKLFLG